MSKTILAVLVLLASASFLIASTLTIQPSHACWHGEMVNVVEAMRTLPDGTELAGEIDHIGHPVPPTYFYNNDDIPVFPAVVVCTTFPDSVRRGDH